MFAVHTFSFSGELHLAEQNLSTFLRASNGGKAHHDAVEIDASAGFCRAMVVVGFEHGVQTALVPGSTVVASGNCNLAGIVHELIRFARCGDACGHLFVAVPQNRALGTLNAPVGFP